MAAPALPATTPCQGADSGSEWHSHQRSTLQACQTAPSPPMHRDRAGPPRATCPLRVINLLSTSNMPVARYQVLYKVNLDLHNRPASSEVRKPGSGRYRILSKVTEPGLPALQLRRLLQARPQPRTPPTQRDVCGTGFLQPHETPPELPASPSLHLWASRRPTCGMPPAEEGG